ncbi:hypothetical protein [Paracoccus sp. (in: a-proteobacteria)]|uniref:hypothetical protein n=1 Tax=Paracoccus sp. TaxID=267 RepID=UPI0028B0F8D4|nr:hypothetical protein [Paracoccus sp. (in: a-proteobacteria)]
MSDTEIIKQYSKAMNEDEFLRRFGSRVESAEFVRRCGDMELQSTYRLHRVDGPDAEDHG